MTWLNKFLKFLNILDSENKLSISNIAIFSTLGKGLTTSFGTPEVIVFVSLLINYMYKRYINSKITDAAQKHTAIEDLKSVIDSMQTDLQGYKDSYDKISKQANDIQKFISESNLSKAFNPQNKML